MRNKLNTDDLVAILVIAFVFIGVAFALICAGWSVYAFVKYGDKPITEIPAWALWFMFGGGRR